MKRLKREFSYWELRHFWRKQDVVVVGAGITGLSTAIALKKLRPSLGVYIMERGPLPTGASSRNAGFACFGSPSELLADLDTMPESAVFKLVKDRYEGIHTLREWLGDEACDYRATGGYELFTEDEHELYEECLGSLSYLNAELVNTLGKQLFTDGSAALANFGFGRVSHALLSTEEGIIDTGLMLKNLTALARKLGVEIFTGVEVTHVGNDGSQAIIETSIGSLACGQVLICTNAYAQKLLPRLNVTPARAQVLLTEPIPSLSYEACFHHYKGFDYFRTIDGRILLGGGRHTALAEEETEEMEISQRIQEYLESFLRERIIPGQSVSIAMRWSGIMGVGESKQLLLESIDAFTACAVRFGGMGVALGPKAGVELAALAVAKM